VSDDKKNGEVSKGFAGLSSLVSDIDASPADDGKRTVAERHFYPNQVETGFCGVTLCSVPADVFSDRASPVGGRAKGSSSSGLAFGQVGNFSRVSLSH